jgi:hypothetical protein
VRSAKPCQAVFRLTRTRLFVAVLVNLDLRKRFRMFIQDGRLGEARFQLLACKVHDDDDNKKPHLHHLCAQFSQK